MDNQQTTLELIKAFLLADLVERDAQKALSFLSPDICWFGTGVEEDVHGIEQAKAYFDGEIALSPAAYQVVFLESNDQTRLDGTGAAQIKCRITGGGIEAICRCSGAVCLVDGEKKICSLHMSVPDTAQTQGEYFPFSVAQEYEKELREEFFDEMVDGGMLGRYNDPSGEICFVNRQMLEFLGYPSEEVFRKELHNCAVNAIYPEDRESSYRAMEEQLAKDKRYRVEYRMLRRDASVLWVESHGKGITTRDGRSALVGNLNDITARKETQRLVQTRDQEIHKL